MRNTFVLLALISLLASTAYSASYCVNVACNSCIANDNITCNNCPTNYLLATPTCYPNDTYYGEVYSWIDGTVTPNMTNSTNCGTLFPNSLIGGFSSAVPSTTLNLFKSLAMTPHYGVRVRMSALFTGNWISNQYIGVMIDSVLKVNRTYGGTGSNYLSLPLSATCGSSQGPGSVSIYAIMDTGDLAHTASTIQIDAFATICKQVSGGYPCLWFIPDVFISFQICDISCSTCYGILNTNCTACSNYGGTEYKLSNTTCDVDCAVGYFYSGPNMCLQCHSNCSACSINSTYCSACATGFILFAVNNTCLNNCPTGFYPDTSINQCAMCNNSCSQCSAFPSPCSACSPNFYLYNSICDTTCPSGYIQNSVNNTCENCTTWCVGLTITQYVPTGTVGLGPVYFDLNFTHALDFTTFPMTSFQSFSFSDSYYTISMFDVVYTQTSSSSYRISLSPKGFSFILNMTVTLTTMSLPSSGKHSGLAGNLFKDEDYGLSGSALWTYMKPPSMTDTDKMVVDGLSAIATDFNTITTKPGIQQFKKLGLFLLFWNSLQITSCLILLNTVLPQNLYEGIRVFASLIFYDVPVWESESDKNKLVFSPVAKNYNSRILANNPSEFRFRRTGFTSVFLFDSYWQILLILFAYIFLITIRHLSKKNQKLKRFHPFALTALYSMHEISVLYFTLTILFEFTYFNVSNPARWLSILFAIGINVYMIYFEAKRYYDLMGYPLVEIGDKKYDYFVLNYGTILKYIRFEHYEYSEQWWFFKSWFKPYNYHFLSYVKKILMMIVFPLFYGNVYGQIVTLFLIQLGETIRFALTWPFASKWRNIYRLVLELVLLAIFALCFFTVIIIVNVMENGQEIWVTWYYKVGWICLSLVIIFNFGFLFLSCINGYLGCKYTNRQLMDEIRRNYYFKKLQEYEEQHEDVPLYVMQDFVKKGNLNIRNQQKLPDVTLRIEYYRISLEADKHSYKLQVKAIHELQMHTEFCYVKDGNNLEPTLKFDTTVTVTTSNPLYETIERIYDKYAKLSSTAVIIKTFLRVEQSRYESGQEVPLDVRDMHQEIIVEEGNAEQEDDSVVVGKAVNAKDNTKVLPALMAGFPISREKLLLLVNPVFDVL